MQVREPTGEGGDTLHHGASFCWEVAGALTSDARGEEGVLVLGEPRWDCGGERETGVPE
jgi:hypothetical protein